MFLSYVLSFAIVGIYWNNHHHLFQAVRVVDGRVLWANLLLLFWLSLFPFATAWMGEHEFAPVPVALYGVILLLAAIAFFVLVHAPCIADPARRRAPGRGDRQRHEGQALTARVRRRRSRSRSSRPLGQPSRCSWPSR